MNRQPLWVPGRVAARQIRRSGRKVLDEFGARSASPGSRPPDWVGIGTQKSGTTSWADLVFEHPDVAPPRNGRKELHFFSSLGLQDEVDELKVAQRYAQKFPRLPPSVKVGEWTPRYMYDFWTVPILARVAPEAKILLLLRDPVERFISALGHEGWRGGGELEPTHRNEVLQRGLYSAQLDRVYRYFDAKNVLVLVHENCVEESAHWLRVTYSHIGVDPEFMPAAGSRRHSNRGVRRREISDQLRRRLVAEYESDVCRIARDYGVDIEGWRNFDHL